MEKALYMLALVPPVEVVAQIEELRQDLAANFKCKAALKSPVHLTLVPPFWIEEQKEAELVDRLSARVDCTRFVLEHNGFGFFQEPEVVYIKCPNEPRLVALASDLAAIAEPFVLSRSEAHKQAFTPHITIARKDIPKGVFPTMKKEYDEAKFYASYTVKAFFLWKHNGTKWESIGRFPIVESNAAELGLYQAYMDSPLGYLRLQASEEALLSLDFVTHAHEDVKGNVITEQTCLQLAEYFAGERKKFELPCLANGTLFQQQIWRLVEMVPYGQTSSYMSISKKYGNEKAIRAVGAANGKNPIPIIIPCHRIIGSQNNLVGYSGGLWRKEWLLAHEAKFGGQQSLF